jgi:hypothetical protein
MLYPLSYEGGLSTPDQPTGGTCGRSNLRRQLWRRLWRFQSADGGSRTRTRLAYPTWAVMSFTLYQMRYPAIQQR